MDEGPDRKTLVESSPSEPDQRRRAPQRLGTDPPRRRLGWSSPLVWLAANFLPVQLDSGPEPPNALLHPRTLADRLQSAWVIGEPTASTGRRRVPSPRCGHARAASKRPPGHCDRV